MDLFALLNTYHLEDLLTCETPSLQIALQDLYDFGDVYSALMDYVLASAHKPIPEDMPKDGKIIVSEMPVGNQRVPCAWSETNDGMLDPQFCRPATDYLFWDIDCRLPGLEEISQLLIVLFSITAGKLEKPQLPSVYIYFLMKDSIETESVTTFTMDAETAKTLSHRSMQEPIPPLPKVTRVILRDADTIKEIWPRHWLAEMFPNATHYSFQTEDAAYHSVDGVLFRGDTLIAFPPARKGTYRIPDGVRSINTIAFHNAHITDIEIPDSVEHLDEYCFLECDHLKRIRIPASVSHIGDMGYESPFDRCTGLEEILVDPDNENYFSQDGALYGKNGRLYTYPAARPGSFTTPDHCKLIARFAFSGCRSLKEVILSQELDLLNNFTFDACPALEKVDFCGRDYRIPEFAFHQCPALQITIPAGGYAHKYAEQWQIPYECI